MIPGNAPQCVKHFPVAGCPTCVYVGEVLPFLTYRQAFRRYATGGSASGDPWQFLPGKVYITGGNVKSALTRAIIGRAIAVTAALGAVVLAVSPATGVPFRGPAAVPSGAADVVSAGVDAAAAPPRGAADAGAPADGAYTAILGLRYADLPGNAGTVDLFVPTGVHGKVPVVVWSAGSGWMGDNGNRGGERIAQALAPHGYAVAAVAVRSSSQAVFPAQVNDAKAAVRWLRANAAEYRLDPGRFAAMGNSSGGWVAAMLGVTGNDLGLEGSVGVTRGRSDVQAVVDLFAPTDFLQQDAHMLPGGCDIINRMGGGTDCHADALSPESRLMGMPIEDEPMITALANPISYIDKHTPPFLVAHGTDDLLLPAHQSELLFEALTAAGVPATFSTVGGYGHDMSFLDRTGFDMTAAETVLTSDGRGEVAAVEGGHVTWESVADFLDAALGVAGGSCAVGEGGIGKHC